MSGVFDFTDLGKGKDVPTLSREEQVANSFYSAMLRNSDPVKDFQTANSQYLIDGESTLVKETKDFVQKEENSAHRQTVLNIVTDSNIPLEERKNIVQQYAITKELPVDLQEKYAEKVAVEASKPLSDVSFANMFHEKIEYTKNSTGSSESALSAFFAGIAEKEYAAAKTFGLVSEKDYELLTSEYKPIQQKHPLAAGLGETVPLLVGAPFGVAGMATIGAAVEGAAKYAKLGSAGVDTEARLIASLTSAGVTGAMLATPIWKAATLLQAMAINGATFVTFGQLDRISQNYILDAYPELQRKADLTDVTIEAILGAVVGGIFGRKNLAVDQQIPPQAFRARRPTTGGPDMPSGHSPSGKVYEGEGKEVGPQPLLEVKDNSPMGVTATHNEERAANLGAAAVLDDTGKFAEMAGESRATILADHFFSKVNAEELKGVPSGLLDKLDILMNAGIRGYVRTETNPFLYGKEIRDNVKNGIVETIQTFKQSHYHQSKSVIDESDADFVKVVATYGKTPDNAYSSFDEAVRAFANLKDHIPTGEAVIAKLDPTTGKINPLTKHEPGEGDYYVQWRYTHQYNPLDAMVFGSDAVSVSLNIPFLNKPIKTVDSALTALARVPYLNRFFLPGTHFLKEWVTRGAAQAGDWMLGIEQPLIKALQVAVGDLSRANGELGMLSNLILRGSDEGKVWSYGEISSMMRPHGFTEDQVEKVASAYFIDRRIDDLSYLYMNRKTYRELKARDMVQYDFNGKPLYAKPVKQPENVTKIWDETNQRVVDITKKDLDTLYNNGGTLAELSSRTHVAGDYVDYVLIPSGTKSGPLGEFVLNRIKGHSPRGWEEYYFIDRVPKNATLNGSKVSDVNLLAKLRTTHAATGTKSDAEALMKELSVKHPEYNWTYRVDRADANSLLQDAKIYAENLGRANQRGDKLITIDGIAKLEDPFYMRNRSISSIARTAAFDEWIRLFQRSFMRTYSRYLQDPRTFPVTMNDFKKPAKASEQELKEFREAQAQYLYYRSIFDRMSVDEDLWKRSFFYLGSMVEKASEDLAGVLKFIGKKAYPPNILKSVVSSVFIFLNPIRSGFIQASQIFQYGMASPSYALNINKFGRDWFGLMLGTSFIPHAGISSGFLTKTGASKVAQYLGAKIMRIPEKEYYDFIQAWKDSGVPYSVDSNLVLSGVLGQGQRKLVERPAEVVASTAYHAGQAIPQLGKSLGFDPGELSNMMAAWLFARDRWVRANPDVPWNSKVALAEIQTDARLMSGELTQAGSLAWSRGILSVPVQFMQVPYKLMLGILTSKVWSPAEKSRMFAGNLLAFGAGAYYLNSAINWLREKYGDSLDPTTWLALKGGIIDLSAHFLFSLGLDEKEKAESTTLAISKGFAPFGDKLAAAEVLSSLGEKQFLEVIAGPSWSIFNRDTGRIPTALRDIAYTFAAQDLSTKETVRRVVFDAAAITSGGTSWMKYQYALETGKIIAATGNDTGLHADRKSAIAQLFGVQTHEQLDKQYLDNKKFDEAREIENEAKYLAHIATENARHNWGKDPGLYQKQNELVRAYMSIVANNPDHARKLELKLKSVMRDMVKNDGDNAYTYIYSEARKQSDDERVRTSKFLQSSPDPRLRQLAEDINTGLNIEQGKGY